MTDIATDFSSNINNSKNQKCGLIDKKLIKPALLYILIGIWIFMKVFEGSNYIIAFPDLSPKIAFFSNVFCIVFAVYFLFYWIVADRKKLKLFLFFAFGSFAISSYILSHTLFLYDIFFIPLFLFSFLEQRKIFFVFFASVLLATTTVVLLNYSDILHSPIVNYREGQIRYSYGFMHPNTLGFMVVILCICFVTAKKKFVLFDLIVLLSASVFCYYYPNSFTSTFVLCLIAATLLTATILNFLLKFKILKMLLCFLSIAALILIVLFVFYHTFTDSFQSFIDKMPGAIKARFYFNRIAYDRYGLSIFGTPMRIILGYQQQVLGIKEPYFTVDCAYFFAMIQYGIINFAAYLVMVLLCIIKSFKNNNLFAAFLCLILGLYGVSETVVLSPLCMVVYACCFYNNSLPTPKAKRKRIIKVIA